MAARDIIFLKTVNISSWTYIRLPARLSLSWDRQRLQLLRVSLKKRSRRILEYVIKVPQPTLIVSVLTISAFFADCLLRHKCALQGRACKGTWMEACYIQWRFGFSEA